MGGGAGALEVLGVRRPDPGFWRGRTVLVTGHTGFKGAWLALMLARLGAHVTGAALAPEPGPSLFGLLGGGGESAVDITRPEPIAALMRASRPSVVLHLAAQALVPRGFADPVGTFAANLDGTVHVLQAMRDTPGIAAAVMVTTDKVYRNRADGRRFREDDPLGGHDPYSASKAACELAVASWRASFAMPPMATARAGNVMGGGDFAPSRLVPDLVRARGGVPLVLRHPYATRPWQHVLDVLVGYLLLAEALAAGVAPEAVNFGPAEADEASVLDIIAGFERAFATPLPWRKDEDAPPEAPRLALDPSLAEMSLGWRARHDRGACIAATASWYAAWAAGADMRARCIAEITEVLA